ncbi:GH17025 [Drosophila grimshawi]|uniref:GH17025 n=1 Tax=Drosophila grimshawi TaxID=7222 RepID=B4IZ18_DROGR|nr:GH17025 [Drosophila grimshawi]
MSWLHESVCQVELAARLDIAFSREVSDANKSLSLGALGLCLALSLCISNACNKATTTSATFATWLGN